MDPYYEDGSVTIYHGDCREILPGLSSDAVVTDPPFKLSAVYSSTPDADNLDSVASVQDVARLLLSVVPAGAVCAAFYDNRIMPFGLDAFRRAGWSYLRLLTLYRRWGTANQMNGWMSTSDPVLVMAKPGDKPQFHGACAHDCYVRGSADPRSSGHPAHKPVDFVAQIVQRITPESGVVIDPYMGGGSTIKAARQVRVRAIGIEAEERYCEIAARRCGQEVLDFGGVA